MITFPIAKINLGLNVVEKRPDGYHNLETVFYPVPLTDALEVQVMAEGFPSEYDCDLKVSNITIDGDEQRNLVVRAYQLLKKDYPDLPRIHTHLWKGIPTQAGMGGGSSDCAYMMLLLNQQFQLGLSNEQLIQYAAQLGADCAFFILSRPCYAEGIGEKLQPIDLSLNGYHIAVVRPDIPVPTKEAFSRIHPHYPAQNCRETVMQPVETWRETLINDLRKVYLPCILRLATSSNDYMTWAPPMLPCLAQVAPYLDCSRNAPTHSVKHSPICLPSVALSNFLIFVSLSLQKS